MSTVKALQRVAGQNESELVQTDLLKMDTQELHFDQPLPGHVE